MHLILFYCCPVLLSSISDILIELYAIIPFLRLSILLNSFFVESTIVLSSFDMGSLPYILVNWLVVKFSFDQSFHHSLHQTVWI